jgi:hypothetical protein
LKGHNTFLTYGIFHNKAMTTAYTAIIPRVTFCVLSTLKSLRLIEYVRLADRAALAISGASSRRGAIFQWVILGCAVDEKIYGNE